LYGEGLEPPRPVGWYECTATPLPGANFRGVWAASETDIHVVGENGAAFHSNGGCEWQPMGPGFTDLDLTDVWGSASNDVWIVANSETDVGNIFHFDGSGWSLADQYGLVTYDVVWGSDACNVYFGGLGVSTDFPNATYYDCAQFYTLVVDMGWDPITGIWGSAKDDVWVVMQQPTYSVWHGDKSGWTNETPAFADAVLHDVWVASTGEVFAVGEGGTIYHHDGSGWVDQTITDLAEHFYGVWGTSTTNVIAVGGGGMIYQYDGSAWAPMDVPGSVTAALKGIFGLSEQAAFAVGDGGTILFYGEQ
jgi:photosystem II stability/assembly factor-like uncharacterized protein